ncbi:hypothetical protein M407DRAFT_217135 [Tulasnella calospora MUT 4182]|uniref:Uncharacterized protein n=1 Tax=Tulasnella calospora MUT 4182 TaxID=1051891 RepID=A0A0C3MDQ0_9AGAM|nr:hypothetical protein M407DRAFT_217135 [Tulasnella calospora MUT 4182]
MYTSEKIQTTKVSSRSQNPHSRPKGPNLRLGVHTRFTTEVILYEICEEGNSFGERQASTRPAGSYPLKPISNFDRRNVRKQTAKTALSVQAHVYSSKRRRESEEVEKTPSCIHAYAIAGDALLLGSTVKGPVTIA